MSSTTRKTSVFESYNAVKLSEADLEEIRGLADLALAAVEYVPVVAKNWKNDSEFTVHSGSMREKIGFDAQMGQLVGVSDFVGLTQESGVEGSTRRLMFEWGDEDETEVEVDLDNGRIIFDGHTLVTPETAAEELSVAKIKILQALTTILEDAI